MTKTQPVLPTDLLWGARAIANYISRPVRTVYYLIDKGVLPVTKLGPKTIVARTSEIDRAFSKNAAPGTDTPRDSRLRGGVR